MYENKVVGISKLAIIIIIFTLFSSGFIFGSAIIYAKTSTEIYELQDQLENLKQIDGNNEHQNVYYYNDSSISNIYNNVKNSVVEITSIIQYQSFFNTQYTTVQGSGFVYDYYNEMYVITNNHVISDATEIIVSFNNGNSYPAYITGADAYSDLAVLTVDAPTNEFLPLEIVSSSNLNVGDPVIAIGNPLGLECTMTTGIVSQIGRTIEESLAGNFPIANIIQTSAAINPGNSGGPLLNYQGEVIGITTAIIEDSEGLGFAIPSNTILKELDSLVNNGFYNEHSWLGISGIDMTYSIAETIGINITYGWLIAEVHSGSGAFYAGLNGGNEQIYIIDEWVVIGGDVIIAVDNYKIINGDNFISYIEENTVPNQIITLTIIRDNEIFNVPVELGNRPEID
jgi:S1-C subfamily serine protease